MDKFEFLRLDKDSNPDDVLIIWNINKQNTSVIVNKIYSNSNKNFKSFQIYFHDFYKVNTKYKIVQR